MEFLYTLLIIAAIIISVVPITAYICFRMAFYVPQRSKMPKEEFDVPKGRAYDPHREKMIGWIKETRALPREEMTITSFDGLPLWGNYYEYAPGAIVEIMFHGYRGSAERDLCGGVQRCFKLGHSALIVDQRCSGRSDGNVITFGINESRDCLDWVNAAIQRFGPDVKIILTGLSMGAATVMIAAGENLPKNVIGVLADCGYTSAKDIIKKVIQQMKLPAGLVYPFVKLGAKIFGGFDLESTSPIEAMKRCQVPVIFFHGEADNYVPCQMSRENFQTCTARKQLITVPGAGHGLSVMFDPQGYRSAMKEFFESDAT
jgi:fermentation-respiration switch protein FrsA (DUF1100 family)